MPMVRLGSVRIEDEMMSAKEVVLFLKPTVLELAILCERTSSSDWAFFRPVRLV
jgi:hypothetical protein